MTRGTDFAGRPTTSIPSKITSRNFISLGHGDYSKSWAFLRKLSYKGLHIYGSGMKKIEDIITEEVEKLCSTLSKDLAKPILIDTYIGKDIVAGCRIYDSVGFGSSPRLNLNILRENA